MDLHGEGTCRPPWLIAWGEKHMHGAMHMRPMADGETAGLASIFAQATCLYVALHQMLAVYDQLHGLLRVTKYSFPFFLVDEPSSSKAARLSAIPPPMQSLTPAAGSHGATVIGYEPAPQYQDVWITVFGFSQHDTPLILREMGKCGDILQWGTFGQPAANYLHMQFQNKFAAQRALLRNGEQLSPRCGHTHTHTQRQNQKRTHTATYLSADFPL